MLFRFVASASVPLVNVCQIKRVLGRENAFTMIIPLLEFVAGASVPLVNFCQIKCNPNILLDF